MRKLIKSVRIIDPGGPHHEATLDVLLVDGRIAEIGADLEDADAEHIEHRNGCLSPGFFDVGTHSGDPGFEQREDSRSLARAATVGGYTHLAILPDTLPKVDSKAEVAYQRSQSIAGQVVFHPIGAISKGADGKDITEMIDMHKAGALAFSDGDHPVQHAGLMLRALLYAKSFDGIIINQALDQSIAASGQMHEGHVSTSLGLRGIPALAEELMVERDLRLLAYTNSRLHIHNISTAASVQRIREAKAQGWRVTTSVPALNLGFTDEALQDFGTNFKVMPPLRSETDRQALIAGLADGTIDLISSNHTPLEPELKELEFAYADFGVIGLSTCFAFCWQHTQNQLDLSRLIECLSHRPRSILGVGPIHIQKDSKADVCLYDPHHTFQMQLSDLGSKSKNTPLVGQTLQGEIIQTFLGKS